MFVISSERSDERSLLLAVVGMTVSPVSFLLLSHFVTAPLEKWSSPVARLRWKSFKSGAARWHKRSAVTEESVIKHYTINATPLTFNPDIISSVV